MAFPFLPLAAALSEFVPIIGRWIYGENGAQVGQKVAEIAQNVTGEKDTLKILQHLKVDPQALLQFQHEVLKLEQDLQITDFRDRESARLRDVALATAGRGNIRADVMVMAAVIGLIACLGAITVYKDILPGEAVGIISTIAGIFGACLKDAYAFEFGSSRGSKIKDNKLSALFLSKP